MGHLAPPACDWHLPLLPFTKHPKDAKAPVCQVLLDHSRANGSLPNRCWQPANTGCDVEVLQHFMGSVIDMGIHRPLFVSAFLFLTQPLPPKEFTQKRVRRTLRPTVPPWPKHLSESIALKSMFLYTHILYIYNRKHKPIVKMVRSVPTINFQC